MLSFLLVFLLVFTNGMPLVNTLAGNGTHGYRDGDDPLFYLPRAVVFDITEDRERIIIVDTHNNALRIIDENSAIVRDFGETGRQFISGFSTTTFAGIVDAHDIHGFAIGGHVDGDLSYARFNRPTAVAIGEDGSIFVADSGNHVIRKIMDGRVYTFAGTGTAGFSDGSNAMFNTPMALAFGECGNLFVADTLNNVIRSITPEGVVSTVAGVPMTFGYRDGMARAAHFNSPMGIAVHPDGRIFVADTGNHLIRLIENNEVTTYAGTFTMASEIWDELDDFDDEPVGSFEDGYEAAFNLPMGLSLLGDALIVADSANHRIRKILPGETLTITGNGLAGALNGLTETAEFHHPNGVFVLEISNEISLILVADTGNNMIRYFTMFIPEYVPEDSEE